MEHRPRVDSESASMRPLDDGERVEPQESIPPAVRLPSYPRYYRTDNATFAVAADGAEYRLDGVSWTRLTSRPIERWLWELRVDLDEIDPPADVPSLPNPRSR